MTTMAQQMAEYSKALEAAQNEMVSKFPKFAKKFNMAENIVIMDFSKENFVEALKVANEISENNNSVRVSNFSNKNRISIIF
jgi:hypothetical protein